MRGEIDVQEAMRRQERVEELFWHQALELEYTVLKQWWALLRAAKEAKTSERRREVALEQLKLKRLYGPELASALKKWNLAMKERAQLPQRPSRPIDNQIR